MSTSPSLAQLLEQLSYVHPSEALRLREEVQEVESARAQAAAQLARDEAALAQVKPDGSRAAAEEWALRFSAVTGARAAVRRLAQEGDGLRAELERARFLARQARAAGARPF